MINLIYGAKGSGKTKRMIDAANEEAVKSKGNVVFITDNNKSLDISTDIRFINISDHDIKWECCLVGFIKGLIAANADISKVFIDGLGRMFNKDASEMEELYNGLEQITDTYKVDFVLAVSADNVPKFMKKYI